MTKRRMARAILLWAAITLAWVAGAIALARWVAP
jgi:hypothetical protein